MLSEPCHGENRALVHILYDCYNRDFKGKAIIMILSPTVYTLFDEP